MMNDAISIPRWSIVASAFIVGLLGAGSAWGIKSANLNNRVERLEIALVEINRDGTRSESGIVRQMDSLRWEVRNLQGQMTGMRADMAVSQALLQQLVGKQN